MAKRERPSTSVVGVLVTIGAVFMATAGHRGEDASVLIAAEQWQEQPH